MLLGLDQKLDDLLIRALAVRGMSTVPELLKVLKNDGHSFTLQATYRTLSKLQKNGIAFKLGENYGLSSRWILLVAELYHKMEENYLTNLQPDRVLPSPGNKLTWKFKNLMLLDDFWSHLLLLIMEQAETDKILEWVPHPWYYLAQREKEFQFDEAVLPMGKKIYEIIGGDSYLYKRYKRENNPEVMIISMEESPFEDERHKYINVVDDFVLTVHVPRTLAAEFDDFFDRVKSARDLKHKEVVKLVSQRVSTRLVLENNAKKARSLKRKFEQHFGVRFL